MTTTRPEPKYRVIVVDDSVIDREVVVGVLTSQPGVEVVAVARNGYDALEKLAKVRADALVIDLSMPAMGGVELLRRVREMEAAPSVLVVSASDSDDDVRRMLTNGAAGFIRKPGATASVTPQAFHQELRTSLAQLMAPGRPRTGAAPVVAAPAPSAPLQAPAPAAGGDVVELGGLPRARVELVVIGASTGGPDALHHFFSNLPATYRVPTVVVQHMPPVFTAQFAKRLDAVSHLSVREAQGGEALEEGCVYLAPGGKHLVIAKRLAQPLGTVAIYDGPHENSCKPAVDPLFRTAAECYGGGVVGVVFTGMGSDGQLGCRALQAAGGWVMVQDQPSSVVWGMPGYVARDGSANRILPLERMAPELARIVAR